MNRSDSPSDIWSRWLLEDRHGGDADREQAIRLDVLRYVDRVLDAAQLLPGMTLADIGTGDGAVAFRAIERIGPSLRVLLSDLSAPLLRHAEQAAAARGVHRQCRFLVAAADDLAGIADASVDVLTTRSVLAYVDDKPAALREFHRVLKPGGRLSIAEPVLQDEALHAVSLRRLLDDGHGQADRLLPLVHRWKAAQFPDTAEAMAANPLTNHAERDLLEFARACGFVDLHLELHIDVRQTAGMRWSTFLDAAPHPWAPCLRTVLAQQFSAEDRLLFEQMLRPGVEGPSTVVDRICYLSAGKPRG